MSPVQRTLRALRDQGRVCEIVERRFPPRPGMPFGTTSDFLGIIDLIALDPERGVVGVQVCGTDFAAHRRKMLIEKAEMTEAWLSTPGTSLELWGWRKVKKKRGGKALVWRPRIEVLTLEDIG